MKYRANFSVNNGTRLMQSVEDTDKYRLWKNIKNMARAELFEKGDGSVYVEDERGREVFSGQFFDGRFVIYIDNYLSRF